MSDILDSSADYFSPYGQYKPSIGGQLNPNNQVYKQQTQLKTNQATLTRPTNNYASIQVSQPYIVRIPQNPIPDFLLGCSIALNIMLLIFICFMKAGINPNRIGHLK